MNKHIYLILFISAVILSCTKNSPKESKHKRPQVKVFLAKISSITVDTTIQKIPISISHSVVKWKGTKFIRSGSHAGIVRFKRGYIELKDGLLTGGYFEVDMSTIYVTDIPLSDPKPRKNLTTHLKKDFLTTCHPMATFKITDVIYLDQALLEIAGQMTIRGMSKPIVFHGHEVEKGNEYYAKFDIDRFNWNIGEEGSWLEKKIVDALINLEIKVMTIDSIH